MKPRIFLAVFSLILSLFFAEKLIERYFPQKTYTRAYKSANSCFSKSDVTVFTLKSSCTMRFDDYDTGEKFETRINNLGYRGEDFDLLKKYGGKRILVAGDSFILGFGVKDGDLMTTRLENKLKNNTLFTPLNNAKVINAGYAGGFGPDGYYLHLKNYGIKLAPDLVVFSIFVFNDFSDMADNEWYGTGEFGQPKKVVSRTTYVDDRGHLLPKTIPWIYKIPMVRESNLAIASFEGGQRLVKLMKHYSDRIKYKLIKPEFATGEASDSNLPGIYTSSCLFASDCHRQTMHWFNDLMAVVSASEKITKQQAMGESPGFLVLLIPVEFQIYEDALAKFRTDDGIPADIVKEKDPNPQKRMKELLDREKIPYIDLLPVMRNNKERLTFKSDGHWNSKGHEVVAEEIYKWIMENYK